MQIKTLLALAAVAAASACSQQKPAAGASNEPAAVTTDEQKAFYALGFTTGERMSVFAMTPAEQALVAKGMSDALSGQKAPFENPMSMMPKISELARNRQKARSEAEATKGKEFADKAAQEPGAEKTSSGLIYKETAAGTGAMPTATDRVKVHYKGTLIDGTEFDSSYSRNEPATFQLNGVISCWTEGVQKMKAGGKARLVCPASIAYGERGSPPKIPGGSTLIFEVELIEVLAKPEPVAPKVEPASAKVEAPAAKKVEPPAPAAGQKAKHPGQK